MTQKTAHEALIPREKRLVKKVSNNRKVHAALTESEGILGGVLRSIGHHITLLDKDLNILWANDTSKKIFGHNIVGKKCYKAFHQREVPCEPHPCLTLRAFQDGGIHEHNTQVIDKDGKTIFFHCTANVALRDSAGIPTAVVEISRDITDAIRAEKALRKAYDGLGQRVEARTAELLKANERLTESEERFRKLAEGSFEAIVFHENGVIIDANNQYYEMFGYNPEELAGKDAISLTATPESVDYIRKQISLGNLDRYEVTGVKNDGTEFPMEVLIKFAGKNGNEVRMAVIRDLTDRKRTEAALQENEERFRAICETALDSIFLKDRSLRYTHVNPAMERLFQLPSEELIGKNDEDLFGPEAGKHIGKVDSRVLAGEIVQEEHTKPVGEIFFTFHVIKVPIRDKSGEIVGLCGIARDITERKQAEKMLKKAHDELEKRVQKRTAELLRLNDQLKVEIQDRKRAEKQIKASLREKEVLLSEIHHRVKNNFEIISSLLDISSMQAEETENQNLWGDARARIHSMALIHDQLYQSDRFDRIHIGKQVQNMLDYLSHIYAGNGRKITSVIELSDVYLSVKQAIPCALVLNELISNAFKHAFRKKKKGTVRISITTPNNTTVLVKVIDDGDGFPEKTDGSSQNGLGLKMARHLVSGQLKGDIAIRNDGGTEISIRF
jgi:PAS domain S-box-containing protein